MAEAARDRYPIAIAVVDSAGYLLSYQATDGAPATRARPRSARRRPPPSSAAQRPSSRTREQADQSRAQWMGYFPIPGGFPIVVQGETVGATGVGAAGLSGGKDEDALRTRSGPCSATAGPRRLQARSRCSRPARSSPRRCARLVDACIAYAAKKKYTGLGIAIVDTDGTHLAFQGMDGASATGSRRPN